METLNKYFDDVRLRRKAKAKWLGMFFGAGGLFLALTFLPESGMVMFALGIALLFVAIIL